MNIALFLWERVQISRKESTGGENWIDSSFCNLFICGNVYSLSDIRKSGLVTYWTRYYFLKTFGQINNIEKFDESTGSENLLWCQLCLQNWFGICSAILLVMCQYIYSHSEFKPFDVFIPKMSFSFEEEKHNSRRLSIDSDIDMDLLTMLTTNLNKNVYT